ncbi:MAG: NAD-dependent epimerase/dehydratase family protein [Flavobacteriaceae bacterium]
MRILVTGGAGFIGSHVAPLLAERGHRVRIVDSLSPQIHGAGAAPPAWTADHGIEFVRGSVTEASDLRDALRGIDAILHLAAETGTGQSMYEIARYNLTNSQGTANLLQAAAEGDGDAPRFVLASSRAVYGEGAYLCLRCAPDRRVFPAPRIPAQLEGGAWDIACGDCGAPMRFAPSHEDDAINPASVYAATKAAQEHLVALACPARNAGHVILRLQNVYGEGQSLKNPYTGILSIFSTLIRRGRELPVFEDGEMSRDFVHVSDVASAMAAALEDERAGGIVNVGSGERTTIGEAAAALSRAFGAKPKIRITGQSRLGDIRHSAAETGRMRAALGVDAEISLSEGLDRFAAWAATQDLPEDMTARAEEELRARRLITGASG